MRLPDEYAACRAHGSSARTTSDVFLIMPSPPKKDKVGQYDVSFDAHQGSFGGKTGFRSIYV